MRKSVILPVVVVNGKVLLAMYCVTPDIWYVLLADRSLADRCSQHGLVVESKSMATQ